MAYVIQKNVIHYLCTCGILKPISKLYFCRHCLQLRCSFCLCHEVDSHFCGKCAENIPSSEARLKRNRCSNCYDCPCCQHQLSIRVSASSSAKSSATPTDSTSEGKATNEQKLLIKKVYYLACSFCRWNTRDVGIPDQPVASGGWPERENVYANRLTLIQDKFKSLVLWDKQQKLEKEKKKHIQRGKYITITDKIGLTAAMIRKRAGLPDLSQTASKHSLKNVAGAIASEEVKELPDDIFTTPLNLDEVSTLEQRLMQPECQPTSANLLFLQHKHLCVKRSLRCRTCEHNVSKPEYNPNSIKFKIQHFAFYHIPEIRIVTVEPLKAGLVSTLMIKIFNPTQYQTTVTLLSLSNQDFQLGSRNDACNIGESSDCNPSDTVTSLSSPVSISSVLHGHGPLTRQPSITVEPRPINASFTGDIVVPGEDVGIILPPRDDAAEYDDAGETYNYQDDPKLVVWRRSNKVALKLNVIPFADLNIGDEVVVGFKMKHIYVNTITTVENKEPQKSEHSVKVFLTLGKTVGLE